jgi:hypothetical protein
MRADTVLRCEIRRARNGWILKVEHPSFEAGEPDEVVYEEKHDDEVECFADFLRSLNDEFGPSTSRYSPKRIYVQIEPGDKHGDSENSGDTGGQV